MQIVSEALFERIKERSLLHTSTHNRIAFVTQSELVLREITLQAKSQAIKIKGKQVIAISLQNPSFIVILFSFGNLQVRKVESLKEVHLSTSLTLAKDIPIKLRVSCESIYVLNKHYVDVVSLSKEKTYRKIYFQNKKQQPQDIIISTIFQEEIIILQFRQSISITTEGKAIAQAPFTNINTFKVLKDPLFIGESKQFLLVVQSKRYLKVFDIFDLQQILQMQLFYQKNEEIQLKVDPLSQFLMLRIYEPNQNITKRNSLLKINTDFYRGVASEPFFLFDIQIGLKQDFVLFPSHLEQIKGANFHSVDMCFFTKKELRIASLVIDVNHRTKLINIKQTSTDWKSQSCWKDFFFNVKAGQLKIQQKKPKLLQNEQKNHQEEWEKFISKFYQENMQKFKCENIYKINQVLESKKCLEYKYNKEFTENQDALNTLSGSSSFGSLKEGTLQTPYTMLRFSEIQNYSQEQSYKGKLSFIAQSKSSGQSEDSQRDLYFKHIETEVLQKFCSFQQQIDSLDSKIQRMSQVHVRKLKNVANNVKKHVRETLNIDKNVEKWCKEEMELFGGEVKEQLKEYSSILGRLQIMEIRNVKKLKKNYRDFLEIQAQQSAQKLQQSEKTIAGIEKILKNQESQ